MSKIEKEYTRLVSLKNSKLLLHENGRKLYEVNLTCAWKNKHMIGDFGWKSFQQTEKFEIKEKSAVTGDPYDKGFILIDKRNQI